MSVAWWCEQGAVLLLCYRGGLRSLLEQCAVPGGLRDCRHDLGCVLIAGIMLEGRFLCYIVWCYLGAFISPAAAVLSCEREAGAAQAELKARWCCRGLSCISAGV
jgi:hypothetical protein